MRLVMMVVGVVALMAGCGGPDAEQARSDLDSSRAQVQQAVRDVVGAATTAGLELADPAGEWLQCGAGPVASVKYSGGGLVEFSGDEADAVASVVQALAEAGWEVESHSDGARPSASLVRDDLRATLGVSRREPGSVSVGVSGTCVEIPEDMDVGMRKRESITTDGG